MSIEAANGNTYEFEQGFDFKFALSLARARFAEAVRRSQTVPLAGAQQSHFTAGISRGTLRPAGTFLLAYSYDDMVSGQGETLVVSVPIKEVDFERPEAVEDPEQEYFEVGRPGEDALVVTAENYGGLFENTEYPPVTDFIPKLAGYRVVPITQDS